MSTSLTAIVAPMREEVAPLQARLTDVRRLRTRQRDGSVVTGRLGPAAIALAITGDGDRNAREGIAALLSTLDVGRVIAIGVAGALSPDLAAADLVVGDRVLRPGAAAVQADTSLVGLAERSAGARRAVVVTSDDIADSVPEKRRLLAAADAGAFPAVVDLESAAYVAAVARAGIPWLVLRAVSDTAGEALPALLNRARDQGGSVRRGSVVRGLLAEPSLLAALLGLRRRVRQCAEVLAAAVEALLLDPAPIGPTGPTGPTVDHGIRVVQRTDNS